MCGVTIEVDGDTITSIRGDDDDPFSRGHVCPKALALKDVHEDPDRLTLPQRRTGARWETISWEEALAEAAGRLHAVQRAHGRSAVALYQGNPTVHNYGSLLFGQVLARAIGSRNNYSATSADQLPHMLAALEMFGHQLLLPVPDVDRTDFMLMLGANPVASNGSIMTAPGVERRLKALVARGALVVVDPRRTETAALATEHVPITPGGDAALLLAVLHVLHRDGLARPGRLAAFTRGLERLEAVARRYPPSRVAGACGVPAERIERLARALGEARRPVVYGRVGLCTQRFGGVGAWLVNALNIALGALDREGGAMFTTPAADAVAAMAKIGMRGHFDRGRSRVRGLPEFGGEYPVATLADEIETPGEGQVRALVCSAGNPVLSSPNGARLDRALSTLDFVLSIDLYRNETSRHAHLILPPTFALEHDHYDVAFHVLAVRNTAKLSLPLFAPRAGARHDWQIMLELASRLTRHRGGKDALVGGLGAAALRRLGPRGLVDLMLRTGPHGLTMKELERHPHGIDLGPLLPRLPARLFTSDGMIDAAPPVFLKDLARVDAWLDEAQAPGGLSLIGRRDLRSNNSWLHNSRRLVKGPPRCTLLVHPDDAAARGLRDGASARLSSRVGELLVTVELSPEMRPGVVSLPHGWGHGRDGVELRVAREAPGQSLNDLVDERALDELSGTAALNGVPVELRA
ncbi:MAG: molybdopterin-dependent oxidoreductase [Polyangiaceae bacterium]|nr:molybdopterin-dependent oxidoreductase [Polyangiaceae bacterium]